jgi:putative hemolysin
MRLREERTSERLLRTVNDGSYRLRLAIGEDQIQRAQRLRFEVFNLELGAGLSQAYQSGIDADEFDGRCEHLLLEHCASGEVVGTYRLLCAARASGVSALYSAREFDLQPFAPIRDEVLELGRACIQRRHRGSSALRLLWKGIAMYATLHAARYLIGCSSMHNTDPNAGSTLYRELACRYLAPERLQTRPWPPYECPISESGPPAAVPRLLAAYLSIGARVCGPPAIDREFGSIDFLTVLDLRTLAPQRLAAVVGDVPDTVATLAQR